MDHRIQLLEGSTALFPALVTEMDAAVDRIHLETYIFDFHGSAAKVAAALDRAARRGVKVRVVVDGLGTPPAPPQWRERLEEAGVQWRVYSALDRFGLLLPARWRRLHRKLCVVDDKVAFCGGINILDDLHDPNYGVLPAPRFDFAVRVEGPLVADVARTMERLWLRLARRGGAKLRDLTAAMEKAHAPRADAALLLRDNFRHRNQIEKAYLKAIGGAHEEIIIANAYFVPGRKLRKALAVAARRGVRVRLLLQGRYEYFMQYYSSRPVYGALLHAGAQIHEYAPSFLHAKVAVVDGHWATVGSSNLDPLSTLLAREANVVVEDPVFAQQLRQSLLAAMQAGGQSMDPAQYEHRSIYERAKERLALVVMRLALLVHGKEYL